MVATTNTVGTTDTTVSMNDDDSGSRVTLIAAGILGSSLMLLVMVAIGVILIPCARKLNKTAGQYYYFVFSLSSLN